MRPRMAHAQFHDFATAARRIKQGAMHAPTEPLITDDRDFDWRLLAPLIAHVIFTHIVIAVVRVSTSYRSVELELNVVWLGAVSWHSRSAASSIAATTPTLPGSAAS